MTTIVLADDHQIVRQGLQVLIEAEPDLSVIGQADNGLQLAALVERLKPDILIVDLMMPGLGGLEVTRQVVRRSRETKVIILSMHANEAYVLEALRNGAQGYVLKDSSVDDLILAIRTVQAGRRYLSAPLSERAIEIYLQRASDTALDPYETLTAREREVLLLIVEGSNSSEIAAQLSISPRTVESHRASLMQKLGCHTQASLIRYALRRGIVPLEE